MVRAALNDLSWALLDAALGAAPRPALTRAAALAHRHPRCHEPGPPPGSGVHPGQRGPHRQQLSAGARGYGTP